MSARARSRLRALSWPASHPSPAGPAIVIAHPAIVIAGLDPVISRGMQCAGSDGRLGARPRRGGGARHDDETTCLSHLTKEPVP
jgi:hypothetical protein